MSADFGTIVVDADEVVTDENMTLLLDEVDADDDGNITSDEVTRYSDASVRTVVEHEALDKLKLVLDGQGSTRVVFRTLLRNFEGPVDENRSRLVTEHRVYSFEARGGTSHLLEGGLYARATEAREEEPRSVVEFVVIEAPAGWVVHEVNDVLYGNRTVSLEGFSTQHYFEVRFAPEAEDGPKYIPTFAPLVGILVLACVASLKARRL